MRKYLVIVDRHKSTKLIRLTHLIIDRMMIYLILILFGLMSSLLFQVTGSDFFWILYKKWPQ